MKIGFILSRDLKLLEKYKKTFQRMDFISVCDFYNEENAFTFHNELLYDFIFYDIKLYRQGETQFNKYHKSFPFNSKIILLSDKDNITSTKEILNQDICGIIAKESLLEDIVANINNLLKYFAENYSTLSKHNVSPTNFTFLTEREKQILKLFVNGYSYKEVGHQLEIKLDTVRSHIRNIYKKLKVQSKTEAVLKIIEYGLIE